MGRVPKCRQSHLNSWAQIQSWIPHKEVLSVSSVVARYAWCQPLCWVSVWLLSVSSMFALKNVFWAFHVIFIPWCDQWSSHLCFYICYMWRSLQTQCCMCTFGCFGFSERLIDFYSWKHLMGMEFVTLLWNYCCSNPLFIVPELLALGKPAFYIRHSVPCLSKNIVLLFVPSYQS